MIPNVLLKRRFLMGSGNGTRVDNEGIILKGILMDKTKFHLIWFIRYVGENLTKIFLKSSFIMYYQ